MHCSSQEIEEKRKQAQLRLAHKGLIDNINASNANQVNHSNSRPSGFNNSRSPNLNTFSSFKSTLKSSNFHGSKPYEKNISTAQFYAKTCISGTCSLISEDRFMVELSCYSQAAIDIFKTISSKVFNPHTRIWNFHLDDYETFLDKMSQLQPDVIVSRLPLYVLSCCRISKPNFSNVDFSRIDEELVSSLMPFQEEGVCFGIDKKGRCLIADDMGLGKTFQALAIAAHYRDDWPLLIATTSSMKNIWEQTIHQYLPTVPVMHIQYMVSAKDYIGDAKVLIVSHDMLTRSAEKLLEKKFGVFIIDESHTFKNFKAKCTKVATDLSKQAKRVILLSGTPALSRPSELYTQLSFIDGNFFGNFFDYSKRYCDGKTTTFGWDATGKSNLQELEVILNKRFMIRRTKEDVLKMLPNKEQEIINLDVHLDELSVEEKKCLNSLADNYNRQKKSTEKQAALLSFFAETAKIKIPSVCSYILKTATTSKKFIVFAHHQKMLDALQLVLSQKNLRFIRIDGRCTSEQRKYFVDKFQLDDNYVCAILSITAANAGITLTAAQLVIFAELHWNPSILSQAESRAHRIGQEGKVIVRYLLASGTADDTIWKLIQNKQKILKEVGLQKESFENLAVVDQYTSNQTTGTDSKRTENKYMDITSYFKSPEKEKNVNTENFCDNSALLNDGFDDSFSNIKMMEMEFMDDGFDDLLSNVQC